MSMIGDGLLLIWSESGFFLASCWGEAPAPGHPGLGPLTPGFRSLLTDSVKGRDRWVQAWNKCHREVINEGYSITNSTRPDFKTKTFSWARHFQQPVAYRWQVCVSSRQCPVCGVMQRPGNRLMKVKVKGALLPPSSVLYRHSPPLPDSFIPLRNPLSSHHLFYLHPPPTPLSPWAGWYTEESHGKKWLNTFVYWYT